MEQTRLSHFRILSTLGQGGMGLVYKAEDERLGRPVALKVLRPECVADPERRARFLREARAAAAVTHPGIAAIYEIGEENDAIYIAMEYVEGRTLRALVQESLPSLTDAIAMTIETARALERAHGAGVVHRDVKPENVMVDRYGRVRILDFGIARFRDPLALSSPSESPTSSWDERHETGEGVVLGTAAYMSPEQARGGSVDARADLYSLGVLLYELVTGRNPFLAATPLDTLSAVIKDRPRPASESNSEVPPSLDRLLARLMSKEPEERPASAGELIRELESLSAVPLHSRSLPGVERSIAVLPFADLSAGKDQEYFCEGLADELMAALGRIDGLKVAARTSAFQFKGRADDVRRIGRQLGVETVLEGSVRKAGDRVRVTAQLVSAGDGYQLWSGRYDRDLRDIFAIQDEIAATLVDTLKIRLTAEAPKVRRVGNIDAYNLYLQGRYHWNKRHQGGLRKATDCFERAVAADPDYALAHAGVADAHSVIGFYAFDEPIASFTRAKAAAERALQLDPSLPEAHVSAALIRFWYDWTWREAADEFERALELDSRHVNARLFYGQLLAAIWRGDAEPHWAVALETDPLSTLVNGIVGSGRLFLRSYEAARQSCEQALALEPDHLQSLFASAVVNANLGRLEYALAHAAKAVTLSGRAPFFVGVEAVVNACAGRQDDARELLRELGDRASREYVPPFVLAWAHAGLGDVDMALDGLERAYEQKNSQMFSLAAFREFDRLRGHRRFDDLLRRLDLPGA